MPEKLVEELLAPETLYTLISKTDGEPHYVSNGLDPKLVRDLAYFMNKKAHEYWIVRDNKGNNFKLDEAMTPIVPPPFPFPPNG
jgi:hypothetical protein